MKSILFKHWKTKAIADSNLDFEWQTRRLIKPQPLTPTISRIWRWKTIEFNKVDFEKLMPLYARYQVGDVVYIKEAWHFLNANYDSPLSAEHFGHGNDFAIEYRDGELRWWQDHAGEYNYPLDEKKRSPMFLPERFARYFIQITDVRAEGLQEITINDCKDEGIKDHVTKIGNDWLSDAKIQYSELWNSINPKHPWASNPWVWRYKFKRVEYRLSLWRRVKYRRPIKEQAGVPVSWSRTRISTNIEEEK